MFVNLPPLFRHSHQLGKLVRPFFGRLTLYTTVRIQVIYLITVG